jgi:hypothetical protein
MTLSEQVKELEDAFAAEKSAHQADLQKMTQVYAQFAGWLGCLPNYNSVRDAIKLLTGN